MTLEVVSRSAAQPKPDAPPLVFVHGAWHGAWCWDGWLDRFAEAGYDCHALSLRGHGLSPSARSLRWCSIADYVDDVRAVAASLPADPVIVGHSMGGWITQHYLRAGHRAAGAVLLASVPPSGVIGATLRLARRYPKPFVRANLTASLWPLVAAREQTDDLFFGGRLPDDELDRHAARLQDESFRAFLDMLVPLARPGSTIATKVPVAVVGGTLDSIFTRADIERTADAYGTQAHFVESAHDVMLDPQEGRAVELILELIEGWTTQSG